MNPELRLCEHLASGGSFSIAQDDVLEYYDGPVDAIGRCSECDEPVLLALLDWSARLTVRVFALAACDPAAVALLRRNLDRGSCDASRAGREVHAFFAAAGPVERIAGWHRDEARVLGSLPAPAGVALVATALEERLPDPDDTTWFDRLGLVKR